MKHVDVAIIGGSLAGASCVRELARLNVDAVAFERDRFPREKVCGGFLSPGAIDLLSELEMVEAVLAAGATRVRSSTIRMRGREIRVELPRPGLGVSRRALDCLLADHPGVQHAAVRSVRRDGGAFRVQLDGEEITARVVVDAAGRMSRFTPRRTVPQFGVQFYQEEPRGEVLDFWFFEKGYGGSVTVEGSRSNACFLISKDALPEYLAKGNCLVTGPIAYERGPSDFLSIGDAAGMVDPFCGEGMRHALDTGLRAARVVAEGLHRGQNYDTMRHAYENQTSKRWAGKRRLGKFVRAMLQYPRAAGFGFGLKPEYWVRKLWN